jgi:hypothetical protein
VRQEFIPRVLIKATPCPACVVWRDPSESAECSACDHTGYLIPATVSSPVRYESGTQIELAVRLGADRPPPEEVPFVPRDSYERVVAVATVTEAIEPGWSLGLRGKLGVQDDCWMLRLTAVRPPTPEETT